jgi:hypothetical protein
MKEITMKSLLALSAALVFAGAAAAQSLPDPIVGGRQRQPTQQEIDNREGHAAQQWDRRVQSEIDRLYGEIMRTSRAADPH